MIKSSNAPDLIYTMQFKVASPRYLGYTERDQAVSLSNEEELSNDDHTQHDPDEEIANYLGYTDRNAATVLEDDVKDRYPTFNAESLNLTESQHEDLIAKLKKAQKNKAMMWVGVISFDPAFINHAKLRDPKTGKVTQHKLKAAIQQAMPGLLKDEDIDNPHTHWWGDIHLNTEHVHVHLTIFQDKNTRPLKDGEPKGTFSLKSFKHFKGNLHRELELEHDRSDDILLEQQVDVLKKDLVEQLRHQMNNQNQILLLQRIYRELPNYSDKQRWRASNNAYDFRRAKNLTSQLVDDLLKHNLHQTYTDLQHKWELQDQQSRNKYGQHIANTVARKDKQLRAYLMNRVFDQLRLADKKQADPKTRPKPVTLQDKIVLLGIDGNQKQLQLESAKLKKLQPGSNDYKKLRRVMGLRRWWLHQQKLHGQLQNIRSTMTQLQAFPESQQGPLWQFWVNNTQEKIKYYELALTPKFKRKKRSEEGVYQQLRLKYGQPSFKDKSVREVNLNQKFNELQKLKQFSNLPVSKIILESKGMTASDLQSQMQRLNKQRTSSQPVSKRSNYGRSFYLTSTIANAIVRSLHRQSSEDTRALEEMLDQSDDLEREDEREEIENRIGHSLD